MLLHSKYLNGTNQETELVNIPNRIHDILEGTLRYVYRENYKELSVVPRLFSNYNFFPQSFRIVQDVRGQYHVCFSNIYIVAFSNCIYPIK